MEIVVSPLLSIWPYNWHLDGGVYRVADGDKDVRIDDLIQFDGWPTIVRAVAKLRGWPATKLIMAIDVARKVEDHWIVKHCWYGGMGPLADWGAKHGDSIAIAEVQKMILEDEAATAARTARKAAIQDRRREFGSMRADLVLKMLDAGVPYRCAGRDCCVIEDLTVDHIEPLSRGGTDAVDNLQFLCRSCNSRKGNRRIAA